MALQQGYVTQVDGYQKTPQENKGGVFCLFFSHKELPVSSLSFKENFRLLNRH